MTRRYFHLSDFCFITDWLFELQKLMKIRTYAQICSPALYNHTEYPHKYSRTMSRFHDPDYGLDVDFHLSPIYTFSVKKLIVFISIIFFCVVSLSAEKAFWLGSGYEGKSAASDKYSVSSTLQVSYGEEKTTVVVASSLPDTLEGRDLGLSRSALEDLGIWGKGDKEVSVTLLRGSVVELEDKEDAEDSGWYSFILHSTKRTIALDNYRSLTANSFKVKTDVNGEKITFTVLYIAEYEVEEKKALIESLGFTVEEIEEAENPYL